MSKKGDLSKILILQKICFAFSQPQTNTTTTAATAATAATAHNINNNCKVRENEKKNVFIQFQLIRYSSKSSFCQKQPRVCSHA
jgi:hypothetical protein